MSGGALSALSGSAFAQARRQTPAPTPAPAPARGAVGDGVANDTQALQRAIDGEGRRRGMLTLAPGVYRTEPLTIPSGVVLDLRQARLLVIGRKDRFALTIAGSHADVGYPLNADAAEGAVSVAAATGDALKPGMQVMLRATATGRDDATEGELKVVREVLPDRLTFTTPLTRSYIVSRQPIVAVATPAENAGVIGGVIEILPGAAAGGGVKLDLTVGCFVRDVSISGASDRPAAAVHRSTRFDISGNRFRKGQSMGAPGFGQGWVIDEWSHNGWVRDNLTDEVQDNVVGRQVRQLSVTRNVCQGGALGGISVRGAGVRGVVISANAVSGTQAGPAIAIGQVGLAMDVGSIVVSDNILRDNLHAGIQVAGSAGAPARDVALIGNLVDGFGASAPALAGVFLFEAEEARLSGNTVRRGTAGGAARGLQIVRSRGVIADRTHVAGIGGIGVEIEASVGVAVTGATIRAVEGVALRTVGENSGLSIRDSSAAGGRVLVAGSARQSGNDWLERPREGRVAAELVSGERRTVVSVRLDPPLLAPDNAVARAAIVSSDGEGLTVGVVGIKATEAQFELVDHAFWTPRRVRKATLHWTIEPGG
jgi:hypothetical protein